MLDDAVESLEDRVRAPVIEVSQDVVPVAAELSGQGLHGLQARTRHPQAQRLEPGLRLRAAGAVGVDVLEGLAHPARPGGLRPPPRQIALDLQLRAREVRLVPEPQVFRAPEQRVLPGLGLAHLVDGLVGVLDHMELVDHLRRVGQVLADALGEPQAHVARHQAHAVRVAVVRHEIQRELLDGVRILARRHVDHVALRQVGDHGDVAVAFAAGLVDADRLHARVVLVQARLLHVMADEPPQAGVVLADLGRDVRDRLAFRQFHDHGLEQEREPASRPRPRHRNRMHAVRGTRHARHPGVDERLVLEEVRMAPHPLPHVMHRARVLLASRLRAVETRARPVSDRDMRLPTARVGITELHIGDAPGVGELQGGGEQHRGIHTTKLVDRHHHKYPLHPH